MLQQEVLDLVIEFLESIFLVSQVCVRSSLSPLSPHFFQLRGRCRKLLVDVLELEAHVDPALNEFRKFEVKFGHVSQARVQLIKQSSMEVLLSVVFQRLQDIVHAKDGLLTMRQEGDLELTQTLFSC